MAGDPPSPTQVYRKVQATQAQEHVQRIQELEARVAQLEGELATVRRGGGTDVLQRLPHEALEVLLTVFDAVPIPDLSAWERRQAVQRLSAALGDEEAVRDGAWSVEGDRPRVAVDEGDGVSVAGLTRAIVRVLGEVASRYLAQMVEYQGTTPDHVSRARASHLMDLSSVVDAKAQFGLLPPAHQRELFDDHIDQLVLSKDQVEVLRARIVEARAAIGGLLEARGVRTPRDATLLGLLAQLTGHSESEPTRLRSPLRALVVRYADLLPALPTLQQLGRDESTFRRAHAAALRDPETPLEVQFLADALAAVLEDHLEVATELRRTALDSRMRQAVKPLIKARAGTPEAASAALAEVATLRAAVDEARAREQAVQKELVKRFSTGLEREARLRIAASETPDATSAAFERLSKEDRHAHLAALWQVLLGELRDALRDLPQLLKTARTAVHEALQGEDPATIPARRRALSAALEVLRNPDEESGELVLATPIDVEQGLLNRQAEDLEGRVDAFLGKYSRAKRAGMQTLPEAVITLHGIEELRSGKRAALDEVLFKQHRGKLSPKREAAEAAGMLEEHRAIAEGRERLATRKAHALAQAQAQLAVVGIQAADYDAAWEAASTQLAALDAARSAQAALAAREGEARRIAAVLHPPALDSMAETHGFSARAERDARELAEAADAVARGREAYLALARELLKKRPDDFDAARVTLDTVAHEVETTFALQAAAEEYAAGFSAWRADLSSLDKVRTWVRREHDKAEKLRAHLAHSHQEAERALDRLGRGDEEERERPA